MNKFIGCGRLTAEPELKYSSADTSLAICRYTLAIDRKGKDNKDKADFIRCVTFGKAGEFANKYFCKGKRVLVEGHIQTGSYQDKNNVTHYTTDIIVESQEFADGNSNGGESKDNTKPNTSKAPETTEEELPFT